MDLPAHCLTLYRVRARFAETDLMGVIHHAAFLGYLEAARIEYLRRRGITYLSWAQQGVHLAVVETWIRHRRPVFFDDVISVEVRLVELGRVKARFEYKLTVLRGATAELVAEGATCSRASTPFKSLEGFRRRPFLHSPKPKRWVLSCWGSGVSRVSWYRAWQDGRGAKEISLRARHHHG